MFLEAQCLQDYIRRDTGQECSFEDIVRNMFYNNTENDNNIINIVSSRTEELSGCWGKNSKAQLWTINTIN